MVFRTGPVCRRSPRPSRSSRPRAIRAGGCADHRAAGARCRLSAHPQIAARDVAGRSEDRMSNNDPIIEEFRAYRGIVQTMGFGDGLILVHSIGAKSGKEHVFPVGGMPDGDSRLIPPRQRGRRRTRRGITICWRTPRSRWRCRTPRRRTESRPFGCAPSFSRARSRMRRGRASLRSPRCSPTSRPRRLRGSSPALPPPHP